MKLVCVTHPCVTPLNQDFFARVEALTGWRLTLVLPRQWRNEYGRRDAERWPAFRGRLVPTPVLGAGSVPLHVYRAPLERVVERERPDAIYVHNEPYALATAQAFLAARAARGVSIGFYSAQNLVKRYPWPFSALERAVYARADYALPVSEAVLGVLREKGYRGAATVLPLSVSTDLYRARESAGPRRSLTVGYVGRLSHEKGVDVLLDALAALPAARVHAVVVGDGPARGELVRRAARLRLDDRVTWTGYVSHEEMPRVYGDLDVLVVPSKTVPSWKEQFGRVVIEALAAGVPVITSDSGELPRLVATTAGGWVVPEGQPAALADTLRALLDDPAELRRRGTAGRHYVAAEFSTDALARRFAGAIRASVAARRRLVVRRAVRDRRAGVAG